MLACAAVTPLLYLPIRSRLSPRRLSAYITDNKDRTSVPVAFEPPTVAPIHQRGHVQSSPCNSSPPAAAAGTDENPHSQKRENQTARSRADEIRLYQFNHAGMIRPLVVVRHPTTRSRPAGGIELLDPTTNRNAPINWDDGGSIRLCA